MDSAEQFSLNNTLRTLNSPPRSPRVRTSFLTRRKEVHKKITQLYKSQFNQIEPNSIRFLELEARRGRTLITEPVSYTPKSLKSKDALRASVSREHKNMHDGIQIITLPKTQFGVHPRYEEEDFVNKHFLSPDSKDPKLFEFSKKLRILHKNLKKNLNNLTNKSISPKKLSSRENVEVFKTRAGELVCERHKNVITAYEAENEKFRNFNRGLSLEEVKRKMRASSGESKKKKEELSRSITRTVERLATISTRQETRSNFFSTVLNKYPALFED